MRSRPQKRTSSLTQWANVDGCKGQHALMARPSLTDRLSALDQPAHTTEADAIWTSVRPLLVLGRVVMVAFIIMIGEIFDDIRMAGLSIGVLALIAGIPMFLLVSMFITYGDRLVRGNEKENSD